MIALPPATGISGPHAAPATCASTIVAALSVTRSTDPLVRIAVGRDGDLALVSAVRHEEGGMYVFRRAAGNWCRVAGGGGALSEACRHRRYRSCRSAAFVRAVERGEGT